MPSLGIQQNRINQLDALLGKNVLIRFLDGSVADGRLFKSKATAKYGLMQKGNAKYFRHQYVSSVSERS